MLSLVSSNTPTENGSRVESISRTSCGTPSSQTTKSSGLSKVAKFPRLSETDTCKSTTCTSTLYCAKSGESIERKKRAYANLYLKMVQMILVPALTDPTIVPLTLDLPIRFL